MPVAESRRDRDQPAGEIVLRDAELDGRRVDVRVVGSTVVEVAPALRPAPRARVIDGHGGALLPGLHDHHIHLLATAAAAGSVHVGPREVIDRDGLAAALAAAEPAGDGWVRAVGYHQSVAGDLDRHDLDRLVAQHPVRVQHRTGARWVLNSRAVDLLDLDDAEVDGVERDASGRSTGRLHRLDAWLRRRLPSRAPPDLAELGLALARRGVTGVTDTTPYDQLCDLGPLSDAAVSGDLPQRVVVTGGVSLARSGLPAGLAWGPVKVIIDDGAYPALSDLADDMATAHRAGRPVAIHCVTRVALVLALAAWDEVGSRAGDRVEHGFVVPPELLPALRRHGLTVVVQPGFVAERGDEYRGEVDLDDRPHLHPCRSLIDAGVAVAGGTDAPHTAADPWSAMAAATTRTTPSGHVLGAGEVISSRQALGLFLGSAGRPGGGPRRVAVGATADLCLVSAPLREALTRPTEVDVVATVCRGRVIAL